MPDNNSPSKFYTGFQTAAWDYKDLDLDLNKELIKNRPATFILTNTSKSMKKAGIFDGDLLIVDKSLKPISGDIVIAELNGDITVRGINFISKKTILIDDFRSVEIKPTLGYLEEVSFSIWGVVTYVVHKPSFL